MQKAITGQIDIKVNGAIQYAKGSFTYNLGKPKREGIVGHDSVHGYKELPQIPFIEGEITDYSDLNLETFTTIKEATITLGLNNEKVIVLKEAWYAADGDVGTEEGNIQFRFEGISAEEIS